MNLEEQIHLHKEISRKIKDLELQKELGQSIQAMMLYPNQIQALHTSLPPMCISQIIEPDQQIFY